MKKNAYIQVNLYKSKSISGILHTYKKQHGFSLVELMVASVISIIILMAAGSTFFTTYKLKEQVKNRIGYEQDVRNATNLLRSDARQLGNFSCLNPPSANDLNSIFGASTFSSTTPSNLSQYLSTNLNLDVGVQQTTGTQSLIFTYLSEEYANTLTSLNCGQNINNLSDDIKAVVYIVGTTASDQEPGLYRVNYSKGIWTSPQLLVSNVSNVKYNFDYDSRKETDCPQTVSAESNVNNTRATSLDFSFDKPPILIRATLSINTQLNNQNVEYVINAMVRQGEVCVKSQS